MSKVDYENGRKLSDDEQAVFERLFEEYRDFIYKVSFMVFCNKEDAEDNVQDVCLKLLPYFMQAGKTYTETFVYVVTRNKALNTVKKHKKQALILEQLKRLKPNTYEQEICSRVEFENLREFMLSVSEEKTELLTLRYLYELSHREIAEILDISVANVQMRVLRAKRTMEKALKLNLFYGGDENE